MCLIKVAKDKGKKSNNNRHTSNVRNLLLQLTEET